MPQDTIIDTDGAVDIDFTGVEETRLIPEGIYPARVDEVNVKNSASSGAPALYFTFELLGPAKYVGRKQFFVVSLQGQARGILQSVLVGLGFPMSDLKGPVHLNPMVLLDQTCGVRIGTQTYEGELRNRVTKVMSIDKVPAEMTTDPAAPFSDGGVAGADDPVAEAKTDSIF